MVTYLGGSILITIFALGGSIVSYNLHRRIYHSVLMNIGTGKAIPSRSAVSR
jgi:hypothetical protein